jgi:hypothetical protein
MPNFRIHMVLHSARQVEHLLEGLIRACEDDYRLNPGLPPLYDTGVRYKRELDGVNRWQTVTETYARKCGDCEDLCAAYCAWLRVRQGERGAHCTVKFIHSGLWHVRVVRANGAIEDPSKVLGMGQPAQPRKVPS